MWLARLHEDGGASSGRGALDELPGYVEGYRPPAPDGRLSSNRFWLRLVGGTAISICEQYVP